MITWLKRNWALVILILIAVNWLRTRSSILPLSVGSSKIAVNNSLDMAYGESGMMLPSIGYGRQVAPTDEIDNRLVIRDSSLSLQVKNVESSLDEVESIAKNAGGYLVDSNLSRPEDAASGQISVRVPESKRAEVMAQFKALAVKVVSESVHGTDVTDEYVDLEARLEILTQTKTKYEEIMAKAYSVSDIMNVQQQLTSLQNQIDNLKGQQKFYEQSAKLTKISIYLSTDELALPYAPTDEWRPMVIFKEAVRSLIGSFRSVGTLLIWGVVYLPVLIPIGLIIWYLRYRKTR